MLQVARWRVILVTIVTVLGIAFALPNFLPERMRDSLPGFLPRQAINLGLDLQGGSQLLLEIEVATLQRQQLDNIADQMASALREAEIRYTGRGVVGDAARIRLIDPTQMEAAMRVLAPIARSPTGGNNILNLTEGAEGLVEARITEVYLRELSRQAAQQSIEVIRRRIDPTGTSEVTIVRQGVDRVIVQAPGVTDPQQLKERIGQTALMTFHMVRELDPADAAAGRIPPGAMLVQPYPQSDNPPEVVERRAQFTGERLVRAIASTDAQTGEFVLSFQLDGEGARRFCRITTDNTGERFAILLDNQVLTAPRINEPICGGSGQISGNFTAETANNLAVMLRAGALPAPLTVIDERTVDASLGRQAIESGGLASGVAALVTFVFMLLAYGLFGVFACIALIVNLILIVAAMSMIGAALTLPGIAGLILTIAMAVDANVLIYERMREEAATGRSPALSIDAGFNRAMITIVDANLTTILAAMILFQFGAGPVRGFAWTLSIGVITSVFTAVMVTQILIAFWFRAARPKQMPI
ncbi:MAG TPA: protein translocase subunit SecD [Vitreimonas sp.]|uniref:protein translocase subunit SecD n=1 Tax=Vitreimonas sp. TaxID=3069702 RepID=UPI002D3D5D81|nr:protein translocase subunit SecD [Vitreimonas sp.]HYD88391.1 protein translocase subunit SecD [Vitreimonas sp.]